MANETELFYLVLIIVLTVVMHVDPGEKRAAGRWQSLADGQRRSP